MTSNVVGSLVVAVTVLLPAVASAQADQTPAPPPSSQGPMIVERVHSGFLVEPDVKVTRFDRRTSELIGAYGGWLTDQTFFIGGGGYWLANPRGTRNLGYGGVIVQWLVGAQDPIGFSVKGLLGGGVTTTTSSVTDLVQLPDMRGGPFPIDVDRYTPTTIRIRNHQGFVIAEPEADLLIRVTNRVRITAGAGYRFTGVDRRFRGIDGQQLDGAVGTLGLQIGPRF